MADEKEKQRFATGDMIRFKDTKGCYQTAKVGDFCGPNDRSVVLMLGSFNQAYSTEYLLGEGGALKVELAELIALINKTVAHPV